MVWNGERGFHQRAPFQAFVMHLSWSGSRFLGKEDRSSSLDFEESVFLRRNIITQAIEERETQRLGYWSASTQTHQQTKQILMIGPQPFWFNVSYKGRSKVRGKDICWHLIPNYVSFEHTGEEKNIVFFDWWWGVQITFPCVYERCIKTHKFGWSIRSDAPFYRMYWGNRLPLRRKWVKPIQVIFDPALVDVLFCVFLEHGADLACQLRAYSSRIIPAHALNALYRPRVCCTFVAESNGKVQLHLIAHIDVVEVTEPPSSAWK